MRQRRKTQSTYRVLTKALIRQDNSAAAKAQALALMWLLEGATSCLGKGPLGTTSRTCKRGDSAVRRPKVWEFIEPAMRKFIDYLLQEHGGQKAVLTHRRPRTPLRTRIHESTDCHPMPADQSGRKSKYSVSPQRSARSAAPHRRLPCRPWRLGHRQ